MNNHKKILKAAAKLMNKKGYHGTSIQMIAEKVGFTKSTVIYHFSNKEGILFAIMKGYLAYSYEEVMRIAKDKNMDGVQKLKKMVQLRMHTIAEHRDALSVFLQESRYLEGEYRKISLKNERSCARQTEGIIRQIQKETGKFYGLKAKVVANAIIGMMNYAGVWYKKKGKLDENQMAEHLYKIVMGNIK